MRVQMAEEPVSSPSGPVVDPEPPDSASFLRAHPEAQQLLKELADESHFLVIETKELEPVAYVPNIGQRLTAELDKVTKHAKQLRDLRALATCRVMDLKPDQVRRILDAIDGFDRG